MFILSAMLPNLPVPEVPFPALLSTLISKRFQVKPAPLIPIDDFLILLVKFYSPRYQSGSFSLINVGSVFSLPACIIFPFSAVP